VAWVGGTLKIAAMAVDAADNESDIKRATFTVDMSGWPYTVYEMIKADRDAVPISEPFDWMPTWAAACNGHSEQVYIAEEAGTTVKPQTALVTWYNPDDLLLRQLMDFDGDPVTGTFIQAQAVAVGTQQTFNSPSDVYDFLMANWSAQLLDPTVTEFGCGFFEDVWEAMWTYNP
jgi:hypothetical protein